MAFARPGRCVLILILLSLIYFAPLWIHPQEILYADNSDVLAMHYPWRVFAMRHWHASHTLPLWCPATCAGQPYQADTQTTLYYPPHLVFYVPPLSWIAPLYGVLTWAHVLLAGLGMFAYARSRSLAAFPALIAAAGFMFAGKWLLHLLEGGHYVFAPLAWLPLLLLASERAIERRQLASAVAAGVLASIIFLGAHPQLTLYIGYFAALWTLQSVLGWRGTESSEDSENSCAPSLGRRALWWLLTWSIAGVVAVGLTAVQLLPALELAEWTSRARLITPEYSNAYDLTLHSVRWLPRRVLSLLGPQHFSGSAWESVGALGILWTGCAVLAAIVSRRATVRFQAAFLALLILLAFVRVPVPGLSLFRIPVRVLLLAGLPLGMLAGHLTQHMFGDPVQHGRRLRWVVLCLAALVALYLPISLHRNPPPVAYWVTLAVAVCAGGGTLLWRSRQTLPDSATAIAWLGLLLAELWAMHWPHLQTRPVADVYPVNDAVRFLAERPGSYRVLDIPLWKHDPTYSPLSQGLCCLHDVAWVRGLNTTDLYPYKQFLNFLQDRGDPPELSEMPVVSWLSQTHLSDLLGVRYLVCPADEELPADAKDAWRAVRTLRDNRVYLLSLSPTGGVRELPPFTIYERTKPLPRAFVIPHARPNSGNAAWGAALRELNPRRDVLLDAPGGRIESTAAPQFESGAAGPDFEEATVVADAADRVILDVERDQPGYLVLLDAWYPGWKCRLEDGREVPVWRANGLFRAVRVPAGRHRVEFVFAPALYRLGQALSLGTLTLLAVLVVLRWVGFVRLWRAKSLQAALGVPRPRQEWPSSGTLIAPGRGDALALEFQSLNNGRG